MTGKELIERGVLRVRLEEIQAITAGLSTAKDIIEAIQVVRERADRLQADMEALGGPQG